MYIDDFTLENENLTVTVFETEESENGTDQIISLEDLEQHAQDNDLLSWCNDYADHNGEHVQETGVTEFEDAIQDNDTLLELAKDYIINN